MHAVYGLVVLIVSALANLTQVVMDLHRNIDFKHYSRSQTPKLQTCIGKYALCAASSCNILNGKTIDVITHGVVSTYPAVDCVCPIIEGIFFSSPGTGNMPADNDCEQPDSNHSVWSMYSLHKTIPQAPDWQRNTPAEGVVCASVPNGMANCYSFACVRDGRAKSGVELAKCRCPLNENLNGEPLDLSTTQVFTKGNCDTTPVGAGEPNPANFNLPVTELVDSAYLAPFQGHLAPNGGAPDQVAESDE